MKPTLEDLRLSAEGCGHKVRRLLSPLGAVQIIEDDPTGAHEMFTDWNPPENAEQDRECLKELRKRGFSLSMSANGECYATRNFVVILTCDWEDFACLALAEIVRREK